MGAHGGEPARRPGGFAIRLQKMSQPIWGLRICNPQQARMLLLDWGLQSPRLPLKEDGIFTFSPF